MSTTRAHHPNVVLIVVDDLGWRDLTCYGSSFYETPNIDRLADRSALFTDAYASAPVCSPTRASLLSGKYPARVGVTQYIGGNAVGKLGDVPYLHGLPPQEFSLARAFGKAGYQTWHVGKWHLGKRGTWPDRHGFDANVGGCDWGRPRSYWSPYDCPTLTDGPDGEYLTDRLTDEAIALLDARADRPFFLNLWHYAVHTPIDAPPDLVEKYRRKADELGLDQRVQLEPGEEFVTWHNYGQRIQRRTVQGDPAYAAMIENLDTNVGRLLDALEDRGLAEDTIVVFTSDNGGLSTAESSPTCNAPLAEGKGWTAEGGLRVPLMMRVPGHDHPRSISVPVTTPDLYPTLLSAAGLPPEPDQHLDGADLSPLLAGATMERGPIYWHYPHYGNQGGRPGAVVRDGRWKLIRHFEDDREELFDLDSDISERLDRAGSKPEVVERLSRLLSSWLDEVRALIPQPNPHPVPYDL